MNHYSQTLEALKAQPDHELKQVGDQWQTPKAIAWGLFHTFAPKIGPVVIDVFADECNHLVANYYTAADNALMQDLAGDCRRLGGAAYGNPPYSIPKQDDNGNPLTGMENILNWCREQRDAGAKIMLLIKAATSDGWWPEDADFIQFIAGRIAFEAPAWYKPRDPKKDKPTASGFASAVMIWDKEWKWERRPVERLNRDDLITTGNILLGMIEQRASELSSQATIKQPVSNPYKLPEHELSTDSLQLPDHIVDASEMVGTDTNDGTKALTIPTVEYTSEEIADQLTSGKLPFTGDHLALMLQLDGMFGKRDSYTTSQIRAAILAFDESGMVTKFGEVVAAVAQVDDTNVVELTEEQNDLFEHFDTAMSAGTEPVPEQEAEPAPVVNAALPAQSEEAEIYFDVLGIPQNLREMFKRCDETDIERSGYAVWAKGRFAAGKLNGIGIRSSGDFKKGYMYEPVLVVYHNGHEKAQHASWPAAVDELNRLILESERFPMGASNPFFAGFYNGNATYDLTVNDRLSKVSGFTLEQCHTALKIPALQSSVKNAIETRIRKLQKEQAAA